MVFLAAIPIVLGLCKIGQALGQEYAMRRDMERIWRPKLWLLYLAVPAYVLLSVA